MFYLFRNLKAIVCWIRQTKEGSVVTNCLLSSTYVVIYDEKWFNIQHNQFKEFVRLNLARSVLIIQSLIKMHDKSKKTLPPQFFFLSQNRFSLVQLCQKSYMTVSHLGCNWVLVAVSIERGDVAPKAGFFADELVVGVLHVLKNFSVPSIL